MTELVELPDEDIAIKKALARLGADSIEDCDIEVDAPGDIPDKLWEKNRSVESTKDVFGLNSLLKSDEIREMLNPESLFNKNDENMSLPYQKVLGFTQIHLDISTNTIGYILMGANADFLLHMTLAAHHIRFIANMSKISLKSTVKLMTALL